MTPEKAIELNEESERSLRSAKFTDYADAVALGNEALKLMIAWRKSLPLDNPQLLPGETEND